MTTENFFPLLLMACNLTGVEINNGKFKVLKDCRDRKISLCGAKNFRNISGNYSSEEGLIMCAYFCYKDPYCVGYNFLGGASSVGYNFLGGASRCEMFSGDEKNCLAYADLSCRHFYKEGSAFNTIFNLTITSGSSLQIHIDGRLVKTTTSGIFLGQATTIIEQLAGRIVAIQILPFFPSPTNIQVKLEPIYKEISWNNVWKCNPLNASGWTTLHFDDSDWIDSDGSLLKPSTASYYCRKRMMVFEFLADSIRTMPPT
ncbi:hypothetical protein HELRODRAFT_192443 [Helobdella robusta]|uniref:Uncharacterized protein n=1 Tax=Helobdella robusta TaxID=6412 RepID=T1FTY9_HELRO|nr:hypothetical protein HELRODRAFT_192443 [Helobdella robusta]ESO00840.1 hypothetical protein HELRODRAFT_192443 [Helobdella robusta]